MRQFLVSLLEYVLNKMQKPTRANICRQLPHGIIWKRYVCQRKWFCHATNPNKGVVHICINIVWENYVIVSVVLAQLYFKICSDLHFAELHQHEAKQQLKTMLHFLFHTVASSLRGNCLFALPFFIHSTFSSCYPSFSFLLIFISLSFLFISLVHFATARQSFAWIRFLPSFILCRLAFSVLSFCGI